jgi:hypothetical protein
MTDDRRPKTDHRQKANLMAANPQFESAGVAKAVLRREYE